jgi:hypothetical protein
MTDRLPKSVLRYVWSIRVLKAGLGMTNENQVREFFHDNPHMLEPFERMNRNLEMGVVNLQNICISELQAYMTKRNNPVVNFNQPMIEDMPDLNQRMIEDTKDEDF